LTNCKITCNEEFITRIGVSDGLFVLVTGGMIPVGGNSSDWRTPPYP